MARRGRLILIVDPDLDFVEGTRLLLDGERLLTARSLEEAKEIAMGGRVDAAVLGPSFGNESGVRAAGALLAVDPGIHLVLAANVVTNRVLLAALQTGFADVVDTPLTVRKLGSSLTPRSRAGTPACLPDVLVELAPAEAVTAPVAARPATAAVAAPPPAPATMTAPEAPPQVAAAASAPTSSPAAEVLPSPFPPPLLGGSPHPPAGSADLPPLTPHVARPPEIPEAEPDEPRLRPMGEGRVIVVVAGKGGSGKSVIATNLALALTFAVGEDAVAIVDADLLFGDVALLLQMDPVRTLAEAAAQMDDLSEARLDAFLLRHESGLRVLPAPSHPAAADGVAPKAVVQVVEKMRCLYHYVVVDTGGVLDDVVLTLLDHADDVILAVDMDLPSVKNAKVVLGILRTWGYPMGRLRLVVNRINAKARFDLVELERSLGLPAAAAIPSDHLVSRSVNAGVPVVALSPRSRVARA